MKITKDPLNRQAANLTEAESLIRLAVKDALFKRKSNNELDREVYGIIRGVLDIIEIPSLKQAALFSLTQFYNMQRRIAEQLKRSARLLLFLALSVLWGSKHPNEGFSKENGQYMSPREARKIINGSPLIPPEEKREILNFGHALNIWHERYIKDYVRPTLDRMAREEALDPESEEYLGRRSTLRNRAEREVRHQAQVNQIEELKEKGVRLVIASSHANCSERCRPWQGRVYSLDGTRGITSDGRPYVPLEEATNILTPNGKWFNGLLGFNCRHYLVPYKHGYKFPSVSAETEEKQYRIDQTQRHLERKVREWSTKAEMYKGADPKAYSTARKKAVQWNNRYIEFSRRSGRAYFPSRTRLL